MGGAIAYEEHRLGKERSERVAHHFGVEEFSLWTVFGRFSRD
jgi:hypothetical protein